MERLHRTRLAMTRRTVLNLDIHRTTRRPMTPQQQPSPSRLSIQSKYASPARPPQPHDRRILPRQTRRPREAHTRPCFSGQVRWQSPSKERCGSGGKIEHRSLPRDGGCQSVKRPLAQDRTAHTHNHRAQPRPPRTATTTAHNHNHRAQPQPPRTTTTTAHNHRAQPPRTATRRRHSPERETSTVAREA